MTDSMLRAVCHAEHVEPEVFFPLDEVQARPPGVAAVAHAKSYCRRCPVADACLRMAFEQDDPGHAAGVFGGMTGPERDAVRATPRNVLLDRHAATAEQRRRRVNHRGAARCSECGTRQHLLVRDGTVTQHPRWRNGNREHCAGSHKMPRPAEQSVSAVRPG